eukprot:1661402-Pleurochrysis_carterae.AAC.4
MDYLSLETSLMSNDLMNLTRHLDVHTLAATFTFRAKETCARLDHVARVSGSRRCILGIVFLRWMMDACNNLLFTYDTASTCLHCATL